MAAGTLACFARHALLLLAVVLQPLLPCSVVVDAQPSPGFYPSKRFQARPFYRDFRNLWGAQHQSVSGGGDVTIWLDSTSGSGFKSRRAFRSGYFGASVKLQPGYTAGVITAFYLSNSEAHPGFHDEVDMEFLGTTPGRPYTLQTNVYIRGSGDGGPGRVVGREVKFHLDWFDPTADFHHYAVLWNPSQIIFYVDDVPIRRYPRRSAATFPRRPMWVYGSIWDASSWATDDGRYKADYRFSPFVARFSGLILRACSVRSPPQCRSPSPGPSVDDALSPRQEAAMRWVQRNHMVYNYCLDPKRDHARTPECIHHAGDSQ
ncbi:xyloglucan endotransglucosylase/hydrolase protein 31-like [Phragmites australis]|uniref:xyloglucan endotransglucosylase/hydrolase protein 31-like n=1 Tax=Phragmites australis TaxID=29695 RepID=UPI002D76E29D|nr:xyloglucan endotransglucosylase/hydrolase protein 31-like [Phragmites australis]